jgi:DNA-binding NarL/FixJ family response regulator
LALPRPSSHRTTEALRALDRLRPDVIVSDYCRTVDGQYRPKAGRELLEQVRAQKLETPFIVYSSSRAVDEADLAGLGASFTSSPSQLVTLVTTSVARRNGVR